MTNAALSEDDPRLPAVRARLFALVRSLCKTGVLEVPLALVDAARPALHLLAPVWRRLRLELLAGPFLTDILPSIEQQMHVGGRLDRRESPIPPRAAVDWPQTGRRALAPGSPNPVIVRRWQRELDLPENRLARRCLEAIAAPLESDAPLAPAESALLRNLQARAEGALRRPPWTAVSITVDDPDIELVRRRVQRRPAYSSLLEWWSRWQAWHQAAHGGTPLLDPGLEPGWLFELLVLFELVAELADHYPVHQARALSHHGRSPAFIARTPSGTLEIYYRSGSPLAPHRSLDELISIPDIVIRLPADRYIILDAKNYGPAAHAQALYKMLGYLYQYGYAADGEHRFGQVLAGVLAFPTEEKEGKGLKNWQRELPGAQRLFAYVLPPTPDERYTGLPQLVRWLTQNIDTGVG